MPSCLAPWAMLPQSTTVARIWRSRSLSRRPMRLSQFDARLAIGVPYSLIQRFYVPGIACLGDDGPLAQDATGGTRHELAQYAKDWHDRAGVRRCARILNNHARPDGEGSSRHVDLGCCRDHACRWPESSALRPDPEGSRGFRRQWGL